jgi:hypothetical protein
MHLSTHPSAARPLPVANVEDPGAARPLSVAIVEDPWRPPKGPLWSHERPERVVGSRAAPFPSSQTAFDPHSNYSRAPHFLRIVRRQKKLWVSCAALRHQAASASPDDMSRRERASPHLFLRSNSPLRLEAFRRQGDGRVPHPPCLRIFFPSPSRERAPSAHRPSLRQGAQGQGRGKGWGWSAALAFVPLLFLRVNSPC